MSKINKYLIIKINNKLMGCVPPSRKEELTTKDIGSCMTKPQTDSSPPTMPSNDINNKPKDTG
jgi:hypothetical protein